MCRRRPGSAALPRPGKGSSATASCVGAARPPRPGCRCARRGAVGVGRSCESMQYVVRSSSSQARPRGAGRCNARVPRGLPFRSACRGTRPGLQGRDGRRPPCVANAARREAPGSRRPRDHDPFDRFRQGSRDPCPEAPVHASEPWNRGQTPDVAWRDMSGRMVDSRAEQPGRRVARPRLREPALRDLAGVRRRTCLEAPCPARSGARVRVVVDLPQALGVDVAVHLRGR